MFSFPPSILFLVTPLLLVCIPAVFLFMKHNFILPLHRHVESQPDVDNGTKAVPCYDSAKAVS